MDALEKICDNDAEREFMADVVVNRPQSQNKQMVATIKELTRQKRILRFGLRTLMDVAYPEAVRRMALAILTDASTPPDLGIREGGEGRMILVSECDGVIKDGSEVTLKRHSFKDDPARDAACRMTEAEIDERARAE